MKSWQGLPDEQHKGTHTEYWKGSLLSRAMVHFSSVFHWTIQNISPVRSIYIQYWDHIVSFLIACQAAGKNFHSTCLDDHLCSLVIPWLFKTQVFRYHIIWPETSIHPYTVQSECSTGAAAMLPWDKRKVFPFPPGKDAVSSFKETSDGLNSDTEYTLVANTTIEYKTGL